MPNVIAAAAKEKHPRCESSGKGIMSVLSIGSLDKLRTLLRGFLTKWRLLGCSSLRQILYLCSAHFLGNKAVLDSLSQVVLFLADTTRKLLQKDKVLYEFYEFR